MFKFVIRRLFQLIPVLLAAVTLTFFLVRLAPGGPFSAEKQFPEEAIKRLNEHYGLDKPIMVQYGNYLKNVIRGDLGPSMQYHNRTVNEIIGETFPISLELGCYAMIYALMLGLTAGVIAALRPNTALDHTPMSLAMIGMCMPTFVMGPILVLVFALGFQWLNASGWETAADRILPTITLGSVYGAYIARLTRGSMLEILPMDYIRTARAKGLSETKVITKHALKNGILPVVSFLGPATAGIITGSFVVETIFQIPGMGKMFVQSAFNRDYALLLGLVVFYASLLVVFNLFVDLALIWLNPKLKIEA
jgi:oligopeptide transport system permease protein